MHVKVLKFKLFLSKFIRNFLGVKIIPVFM